MARKKKTGKKMITAKQKTARRKNMAVARQAKKRNGGMSATKRKFIQSQSQSTLKSWISSAKKRGDKKSVAELTPFLKKKKSNAAFKRRGKFLASRI